MSPETERKWLLDGSPEAIRRVPGERIEQGYLAVEPEGAEVRLRRRAGRSTLTVERSGDLERCETEIALTNAQFENLWPATEGARLVKTRYRWLLPRRPGRDDAVAEVDVYAGDLEGLVLAQVEFPSVKASGYFRPPKAFGREVTRDPRYENRRLAREGRPEEPA